MRNPRWSKLALPLAAVLAATAWLLALGAGRRSSGPTAGPDPIVAGASGGAGARGPTAPAAAADPARERELGRQALARLRRPIGTVLATQDGFGPDAAAREAEAMRALFADPDAPRALRALYDELPQDASLGRWQIVIALGRHPDPGTTAFLRDLAVTPPWGDPETELPIRASAALGVLAAYEAGQPAATAALEKVLREGVPQAVESVSLQLSVTNRLAPWQRELLAARGIPHDFRPMSAADEAALDGEDAPLTGKRGRPPEPVPADTAPAAPP